MHLFSFFDSTLISLCISHEVFFMLCWTGDDGETLRSNSMDDDNSLHNDRQVRSKNPSLLLYSLHANIVCNGLRGRMAPFALSKIFSYWLLMPAHIKKSLFTIDLLIHLSYFFTSSELKVPRMYCNSQCSH